MLVVETDKVDRLARCERRDSRGGRAGDDERRVDLAVLQGLDAVAEGLIGRVDAAVGVDAVSAEHVDGVEVHARAGGADGDVLTLEVGNALDAGVERDDLHLLHVERGDRGEIVHLAALLEQARALVSVGRHVGLDEAELGVAGLQGLDVRLGAAGGDGRDAGLGLIADLTGQHRAKAVVGTGLAAGGKGEVPSLAAAGGERKYHRRGKDKRDPLFHVAISFSS